MPGTSTLSPSPALHFTSSPYKLWPATPATSTAIISQEGMLGHVVLKSSCNLIWQTVCILLSCNQLLSSYHSSLTSSRVAPSSVAASQVERRAQTAERRLVCGGDRPPPSSTGGRETPTQAATLSATLPASLPDSLPATLPDTLPATCKKGLEIFCPETSVSLGIFFGILQRLSQSL